MRLFLLKWLANVLMNLGFGKSQVLAVDIIMNIVNILSFPKSQKLMFVNKLMTKTSIIPNF